ncbi:hypothetical protein QE94_004528, partial [Salmonella enterica subsp. enterica]|nr:hypothetical protein [Salmonella enterica subsp. enterica]
INLYQYAPNPLSWIDPLGLKCGNLGGMKLSEAKKLMSLWSKSTFRTLSDSIRYHARTHGFANDIAKYLRKAAAFNRRGSRTKYPRDGGVRYEKGKEFRIERDGKIVTYGENK